MHALSQVRFFTPIDLENFSQPSWKLKTLEKIDQYFYWAGRKARVLSKGPSPHSLEVVLTQGKPHSFLLTVLKIISYANLILPLILLKAKYFLRKSCDFKVISSDWPNFDIASARIKAEISRLLPFIVEESEHEDIVWLSRSNNRVFALKKFPCFVFKTWGSNGYTRLYSLDSNEDLLKKRFENMERARAICQQYHLDHLVIPQARSFEVKENIFIAEERIEFNCNEPLQEKLYVEPYERLMTALRQLAQFISLSGFCDVKPENIPLLDRPNQPLKIVLVDLEHLDNSQKGFIGEDMRNPGLIQLVSNHHWDVILDTSRSYGHQITPSMLVKVENRQQEYKELQTFYARKGIQSGSEPLNVDINTLNLPSLAEHIIYPAMPLGSDFTQSTSSQMLTIDEVVQKFINYFNQKANSSGESHPHLKRYFQFKLNQGPFYFLYSPAVDPHPSTFLKPWIALIGARLCEQGYLFKFNLIGDDLYEVQG
jgi:hypothetical protein